MREMISRKATDKIKDPRPVFNPGNLKNINRRRYSGNVYTSFNTLLIIGMALLFTFALWGKMKFDVIMLIPVLIMAIFFWSFGTQMNYFLIDDGYLIIKNHYLVWMNKKLNLQDITEVDVEQPNKRSKGLRINTRDFKSKLYGAGSLRDKNWQELMNDLKLIGIPVRDDG
jgi:hypothetical protein